MSTLPDKKELHSKDRRRTASYEPYIMDLANGKPTPAYRVIRTVRRRRGFGTVLNTITTFVRDKKTANRHLAHWVRMTT